MMRFIRVAAMPVLAIVGFTGCGSGSSGGSSSPGSSVRVDGSQEERVTLLHESRIKTAQCMHRMGFAYSVPELGDEPEALLDQPYGNDDVAFARRYPVTARPRLGGGIVDLANLKKLPVSKSSSLRPAGGPAYQKALIGSGEAIEYDTPGGGRMGTYIGGCSAEGIQKVFGPDIKRWVVVSNVVEAMNTETSVRVYRDPSFQSVLAKWRECVTGRGFRVEGETKRSIIAKPDNVSANVANAECGAEFDLQATGNRLANKYRAEIARENEAAVIDYNALVAGAQKRLASEGTGT